VTSNRFFAIVGDAELDEGNVWEALYERALGGVGEVTWVVDVNRQSLDVEVARDHVDWLRRRFLAADWRVIEVKHGRERHELTTRPGGREFLQLLEMLPSEEFHRLLRCPAESVKDVILSHVPGPRHPIAALVDSTSESELAGAVGALGGHDIPLLIRALSEAREETARPVVVLAHTIKGWGLPMAGDP